MYIKVNYILSNMVHATTGKPCFNHMLWKHSPVVSIVFFIWLAERLKISSNKKLLVYKPIFVGKIDYTWKWFVKRSFLLFRHLTCLLHIYMPLKFLIGWNVIKKTFQQGHFNHIIDFWMIHKKDCSIWLDRHPIWPPENIIFLIDWNING